MFWQKVRIALLAGALAATVGVSARANDADPADDKKEQPKEAIKEPKDAGKPADPCPPAMRKICVTEWVPEKYECKRTVYKAECREEKYTAYKCEWVADTRINKVCVMVPHVEERIVTEKHYVCKPVTHVERKCVDKGHWECREVPCGPSLRDRVRDLCGKKKNDCCDPCQPVRTRTTRVWVPCPVWEEKCVTRMERVCELRQVKCNVTVCKPEMREEKCTVMVMRKTPYEATRTVTVCVPHTEIVTATRMVCRTVEKLVPVVDTCCETTCCKPARRSWFNWCSGGKSRGGCCD